MKIIADPNYLNVVGLVFDIVGAALLAKSIFFNLSASISAQATPTYDDNSALRLALCEQRVDAWFGMPMLLLGFAVQLASDFLSIEFVGAALMSLLALLYVAAYCFLRGKLVEYSMAKSKPKDS